MPEMKNITFPGIEEAFEIVDAAARIRLDNHDSAITKISENASTYVTEETLNSKGYLTEHQDISSKLDADKLPEAIDAALAQAKASGEFDGKDGASGADGVSATHSWNGTVLTVTSASGTSSADLKGPKGDKGDAGAKGADGKTPVKGVDYYTDADQEAIVQQVIAALGTPVFGRVDADNNIILTGELADGTYTIKYEDGEGNVSDVGSIVVAPEPTYTNVLPLAIGSDGKPYNGGKGWKAGTRLNSSGAESTSSATEIEVTGFIPVKNGDVIYLSGITMNNGTYANQTYMWLYDSSFKALSGRYKLFSQYSDDSISTHKSEGYVDTDASGNITKLTVQHNVFYTGTSLADLNNTAYIRISCEHIDDNSIITVNEPIV